MILETFEKATEADIAEGINWYPEAFKFASSLSQNTRAAAGVIAAISPMVAWEINKKSAEKIFQAINSHSNIRPTISGTYLNAEKRGR